MMARVTLGLVAFVLLALGVMNAANKAGLLGPAKPPTHVSVGAASMTVPAIWHADTGEFAELRDGVCKLLSPARTCRAFFVKGLGSPRAVAVIAVGPLPAGGPAAVGPALTADGVEVAGPQPVAGHAGAQRYRSVFKKRGRKASLAVTDVIPAGADQVLIQVVAEEPEGRYQEQLLAEIEKTLEVRAQ